jgi:S-adenosylmethionine decarboxylase
MFNSALPTFHFTKELGKSEDPHMFDDKRVTGYYIELNPNSCIYGPVLVFTGSYALEGSNDLVEIIKTSYFIHDLNHVKPLQLLMEAFCHSSFSKKVGEMIAYSLFIDLCIENRGKYPEISEQSEWVKNFFPYIYKKEAHQNYLHVNQNGGSSIVEYETNNGIYPIGRHIIIEASNCDNLLINNLESVENAAKKAAEATGATILHVKSHNFEGQGVTTMILLSESHLTIHTWPEHNYAAVDIFTCGEHCDPRLAIDIIGNLLKPVKINVREILRGPLAD